MSLLFRKATPSDMDAIIDIRVHGWYNTYLVNPAYEGPAPADFIDPRSESTRAWLTVAAIGTPTEQLFVADKDGEVIGLVDVEIHEGEDNMHSFYVRTDQRGSGVGSQLLATGLQWLVDNGSDQPLAISVSEHNTRPIAFYERLGFVITERHVANWWGRNKAEEQIIFDTRMVSPSASVSLERLQSRAEP